MALLFLFITEEASGLCRLSDGRKVRKLSGSSGTLITPDYPYYYPDDVRCTWTISVPAGKVVKLTFDRFRLNLNPDYCQTGINDYVQIRDGKVECLLSIVDITGLWVHRMFIPLGVPWWSCLFPSQMARNIPTDSKHILKL